MSVTGEQFRELLIAALEDPAVARLAARKLLLPVAPIQGGQTQVPAGDVTSRNFGSNFSDTGNYTFAGGGTVGIGTTTPSPYYALHVAGKGVLIPGNTGGNNLVVGAGSAATIIVEAYSTYWAKFGYDYAGTQTGFFDAVTGGSAAGFAFRTGGTERMRLNSTGNLGIGTTSPAYKLDVNGAVRTTGNLVASTASTSLILGGTTSFQTADAGGPELISAQHTTANHVALANWCTSDSTTNARFLLDIQGNHEWAGTDDVDQSILVGFNQVGVLGLYGDPPNGGGLNVVAWKHSTLQYAVTSITQTAFVVYDGAQFTPGAYARVDNEIVLINTISPANTLNVSRHQQSTQAALHSQGAYVTQSGTPEDYARVSIQTANEGAGSQDVGPRIGLGSGAAAAGTFISRLSGGGLSITGGPLLLPSMTTTQRNALTEANGMIIYNTTTNQIEGYVNGAWTAL